ncbi:MAG: hypothetical protein E6K81_15035 [Candidatus Eisenbacteria bacterium]|uniref:PBP domain-containing protein n=1 Tax=Eiseniibacteriota bacterium TaxID=2212470 RepID=A0A538U0M9_UNCEI|nr:MAG: hypothetical protein E6K81_15035 [Candidatus Eisenbacteria bacterium]
MPGCAGVVRHGSLDSLHFGVLGDGGRKPVGVLLLLALVAVWTSGCSPGRTPGTVEGSLTSGRISVVCAPEASALIDHEVAVFDSLYPAARIAVRTGPSREAIRSLLAAECDLAVLTRELEPEERVAAAGGGVLLDGYAFAMDALVLVVHPGNGLENISLDQVKGIYRGEVTGWEVLGGTGGAIEPVIQPPGSDVTEAFVQRVMGGDAMLAHVVYERSDSGVVSFVSQHPGAIGFVTLAWADRGAKALRVAALKGLTYWRPDPEAVYAREYPVTRRLNLYVRPKGPDLANGLITFITSRDGQALVHEEGLVPTTVPVRFVRRSPMLGAH